MTAKICPRCGASFFCTHDEHCQCVGITLSAEARRYLRTAYQDCLCAACLRQIARDKTNI